MWLNSSSILSWIYALPHQKSSPAACSYGGGQELLAGFAADETGGGRRSTDHFLLPLLLKGFQEMGSYFPHPSLECADLQGLIASGGAAL
jgi:hypothetical protein